MDAEWGNDYDPAQNWEVDMNYQRFFEEAIDQLHAERRYRVFADLERIAGKFPRAIWRSNGRAEEITVWCSNDYLGMGQHPDVIAAFQNAASRMGSGAGGTRNISGTSNPLVELEHELADLHDKEAALVFTSGFMAPYWLFALGGLFVVVTLFLPKGILGTAEALWARRRKPDSTPAAEPAPAE